MWTTDFPATQNTSSRFLDPDHGFNFKMDAQKNQMMTIIDIDLNIIDYSFIIFNKQVQGQMTAGKKTTLGLWSLAVK